jgi:hypothetical protein
MRRNAHCRQLPRPSAVQAQAELLLRLRATRLGVMRAQGMQPACIARRFALRLFPQGDIGEL